MLELTIISIIKRVPSKSGVTEPYICKCDDGRDYFAKGFYAGAQECIRELIAAEIGTRFGLRIPPFGVARTTEFYNSFKFKEIAAESNGLRGMPAFVSQRIDNCIDYVPSRRVSDNDKQLEYSRILFFDWWLQNPDRTKGHTNLLEQTDTEKVHVIDHNMVLNNDVEENLDDFISSHVFGEYADLDTFLPEAHKQKLDEILSSWNEIANLVPDEWVELCSDEHILDRMKNILNRYNTKPERFWKTR